MNDTWLADLKRWFDNYVDHYLDGDDRAVSMLELKRKHSRLVAGHCSAIATELAWSSGDVIVAEALGLLHDIARFSQYAEFNTFQDAVSIDHGERGCEIAASLELLSALSSDRRRFILDGIRHHNGRTIPPTVTSGSLPFVKLIRDADKLDIYRIMSESLDDRRLADHLTSALQVKGTEFIDPNAVADVRERKTVDNSHIDSAGDFLLMQLSWVYDINYPQTRRRISDSGIIARIGRELPDTPDVRAVVRTVIADLAAGVNHA